MSKYHFFYGGPLSNWYPVNGNLSCTSEKLFMQLKATTFNDLESLKLINYSSHPSEAKKFGRSIANFNEDVWDLIKYDCMMSALEFKLYTCPEFEAELRATNNKVIVEASPTDRVWGIGYSAETAEKHVDNWGENLLGKALMEIRSML